MKKHYFNILILLTFPSITLANMSGSTLQTFNPTVNASNEFVSLYSTQSLGKKKLGLTTYFDYAQNTIPTYLNVPSSENAEDTSLYNHLLFFYGLTEKLDFGFSSVSILNQEATGLQNQGFIGNDGIINLKALLKYQLFDRKKSGFGLSIIGSVNQVGIRDTPYHGDRPGPSLGIEVAVDRKWKRFLNSFNIGYISASPGEQVTSANGFEPINSTIVASLGSQYSIAPKLNLMAELHSSVIDSDTDALDREALSLEGLAAINYATKLFKSYDLSLNVGVTRGLNDGIFTPSLRVFSGLNVKFGLKKPKFFTSKNDKKNKTKVVKATKDELDEIKKLEERKLAAIEEEGDIFADVEDIKPTVDPIQPEVDPNDIEQTVTINQDDKTDEKLKGFSQEQEYTGEYKKIILNYIEFDLDSYVLDSASIKTLKGVADHLKKNDYEKLMVIGHADFYGTTRYNEYLSLKRAKTVSDYLLSQGVPTASVEYNGYGKRRILTTGISADSRKRNRRVELILKVKRDKWAGL